MNNSRFAISVHIMTLLADAKGELLSSERIAGSININPVLVRKELSNLRRHQLIATREGKNGGSYLTKDAAKILLSDVYGAVKQNPLLGQAKNTPNPNCPVGKKIDTHLNTLFADAEKALVEQLKTISLQKFLGQFT